MVMPSPGSKLKLALLSDSNSHNVSLDGPKLSLHMVTDRNQKVLATVSHARL